MSRAMLANVIAADLRCSKAQAKRLLDTVLVGIEKGVRAHGRVTLTGFGTFTRTHKASRQSRNPSTGESMCIPSRRGMRFTLSGKSLLREVA